MIDSTYKTTIRQARVHRLEGWVERVDLQNRRLHIRTGSRDKIGATVLIPEDCAIHHEGYDLRLQSLLPCDSVNISYREDDQGARIAQRIELTAA